MDFSYLTEKEKKDFQGLLLQLSSEGYSDDEIDSAIRSGQLKPKTEAEINSRQRGLEFDAFTTGLMDGSSQGLKSAAIESGTRGVLNLTGKVAGQIGGAIPYVGPVAKTVLPTIVSTGLTGEGDFGENLYNAATNTDNLIDIGGSVAGGAAGAYIGAGLGSVVPGLGTAIGGGIGYVAGSTLGGIARPAYNYFFGEEDKTPQAAYEAGAGIGGGLTTDAVHGAGASLYSTGKSAVDAVDNQLSKYFPTDVVGDEIALTNNYTRNRLIQQKLGSGHKLAATETNKAADAIKNIEGSHDFVTLLSKKPELLKDANTGLSLWEESDKAPASYRFQQLNDNLNKGLEITGRSLEDKLETTQSFRESKIPFDITSAVTQDSDLFKPYADGHEKPSILHLAESFKSIAPSFAKRLTDGLIRSDGELESGTTAKNVKQPAAKQLLMDLNSTPVKTVYDLLKGIKQANEDLRHIDENWNEKNIATLNGRDINVDIEVAELKNSLYKELLDKMVASGQVNTADLDSYNQLKAEYASIKELSKLSTRFNVLAGQANVTKGTGQLHNNNPNFGLGQWVNPTRATLQAAGDLLAPNASHSARNAVNVEDTFQDTLTSIGKAVGAVPAAIGDRAAITSSNIGAAALGGLTAMGTLGPSIATGVAGGLSGWAADRALTNKLGVSPLEAGVSSIAQAPIPYNTLDRSLSRTNINTEVPPEATDVTAIIGGIVGDHRDFSQGLPRNPDQWDDKTIAYLAASLNSTDDIMGVPTMEMIKTLRTSLKDRDPIRKAQVIEAIATINPDLFEPGMGVGGRLFNKEEQKRYMGHLYTALRLGNVDSAFVAEQEAAFRNPSDSRVIPIRPPHNTTVRKPIIGQPSVGRDNYDY